MDNFTYFSKNEAILMSTHNICFYGELTKIILQLSLSTHFICSTVCTCEVADRGRNAA